MRSCAQCATARRTRPEAGGSRDRESLDTSGARFILDGMDRDGLADFLRRRREALQPADVGLPAGSRRRARGLRREEVGGSRTCRPTSTPASSSGADPALRADDRRAGPRAPPRPGERDHLFRPRGLRPAAADRAQRPPEPGLLRVLDQLDAPAQIVSDLGVTLRQNALAEALVGVRRTTPAATQHDLRWFTQPEDRRIFPADDHPMHSRIHVATLRAVHGPGRATPRPTSSSTACCGRAGVRGAVGRHEVAAAPGPTSASSIRWSARSRWTARSSPPRASTERLVVFTATVGSEDAERLALLSVVGSQGFTGAADAAPVQ